MDKFNGGQLMHDCSASRSCHCFWLERPTWLDELTNLTDTHQWTWLKSIMCVRLSGSQARSLSAFQPFSLLAGSFGLLGRSASYLVTSTARAYQSPGCHQQMEIVANPPRPRLSLMSSLCSLRCPQSALEVRRSWRAPANFRPIFEPALWIANDFLL